MEEFSTPDNGEKTVTILGDTIKVETRRGKRM